MYLQYSLFSSYVYLEWQLPSNSTHTLRPKLQTETRNSCSNEVNKIHCKKTFHENLVNFSLVDVTSTATNILDHYHCLVDCQGSRIPTWSVQKPMSYDGTVCFDKFGIVKSLEDEKVDKVAERMIARQVEKGDLELNSSIWRRTQIRSLAEQRCRTVFKFILILLLI